MKAAFVVLSLIAAFPAASFADEWTKHWAVSNKPELHVTAGDAAVEIKYGPGDGIDAIVKTKGWTIGDSGIRIEERQNGNRVELEVKEPSVHFSFHGNREVKVEIRVPRELAGYLRTGDGPITVTGVHGSIRANTGDGPVKIEDFEGTLDAHTGDGPVTLQGRFDDLHVQTGDGPVAVSAEHGSRILSSWHLQTGDGPVRINLPSDLSANLELHSGDGPIQMDLPLTVSGMQNQHNVHGTLNGGGPEVSVHTGDGPISIGRS
jgi:DUF4097 and DUF4098 domain-containing protein YvlB